MYQKGFPLCRSYKVAERSLREFSKSLGEAGDKRQTLYPVDFWLEM
jgi:hypothetical protein